MTTPIEYALMAGASCISTRSLENRFPAPQGWTKVVNPDSYFEDPISGFEAISFTNGTEIVISYSGTDPNDTSVFSSPDGKTNVALAAGAWAEQLLQAAEYYFQIKSAQENAGKTITLTGHSLGGGLAALVGVFFEVQANTFDQVPFAASALHFRGSNAADLYARLADKSDGRSDTALAVLSGYCKQSAKSGMKVTKFARHSRKAFLISRTS